MKKIFFLLNVLLIASFVEAQTGIGTTTPNASAKLDVFSTTKGFLPPRMTNAQRTAISSPAEGLMVYQTDGTSGLYYYNGSAWIYIINSTTNVVSVVNGGTGTTTATGTGSVVLNTSPSLITPALGTPSSATLTNASGLPIASGVSGLGTGIASFLATPTSSNLASAISDETGSGALVFGTSPTLTTPALGTPSSATLTNASGLPIASGVSGLGTGVASFLATPTSSNLASAISDETGSGALVFGTSPTLTTPTLGVASGTSLALTGTTVSNSTSTGALTVAGGAGIGGALNASSVKATNFIGSGSQLTDVAIKETGSWNVPNGTNYFTIGLSIGTYLIWVNGNVPNGIITYNALVTITNTNVPVAGNYSSWVYNGGGTPLDFISLPDQIVGPNSIVRSSSYSGLNSNNFIFGIRNTTSTTYQVNYGYIKL